MSRLFPLLRFLLLSLAPFCFAAPSHAAPFGERGFQAVKICVMRNDPEYCRAIITPDSRDLYERFAAYKLMPCLPTDFRYRGETPSGSETVVRATMPAGNGTEYRLKMVFRNANGEPLLDLPASFALGLGPTWQDKIALSEQVYLMMRQNLGDKLNCDMLTGLLKPGP